jgi:hypothetical protein
MEFFATPRHEVVIIVLLIRVENGFIGFGASNEFQAMVARWLF